jgi:transcriptional regulator GlxA family with amidase domain
MKRKHDVGVLVFQDVKMLDVAGPSEVFAEANLFGADYRISILTVGGADVRASTGLRVAADASALEERRWDTVLVAGGEPFPGMPVSDELVLATRHLAARADRVASICTGAFVLGAAGLLDGKRATTHWRHATELASRHPKARVEPDRIFVHDQGIYTSAGVSAGIDLALSLVEADHGADLARSVARSLVVYMQRAGGQSQFSAALDAPEHATPVVQAVIDRVRSDPSAEYTLDALAHIARVSTRHLSRLFRDEYGASPTKYVETIRVELAKSRLDAGYSVTTAAELCGFGSSESMRRAFVRQLGTSPQQFQRRFLTTQPAPVSAVS